MAFSSRRSSLLCLVLIIGFAGVCDAIVAASMSVTFDEPNHVAYGLQVLHGQPDRYRAYFDSKVPISALNAIPRLIASHLEARHAPPRIVELLRSLRLARWASILATLLLNFLVCRWAYELYGSAAALASSIMVVLSPNLIAHGTLATTDGYFALGVLLSLYFVRRYLLQPTLRNACLSGCTLALAQLTKPFAIYLYPIVCIFLVLVALSRRRSAPFLTRKGLIAYAAIATAFFLLVINVAYSFDRTFTSLSSYHFESASFIRLQQMKVLRNIPVPLPCPFLQGLDMVTFNERNGSTFGNIYLLEEVRSLADPEFHSFKTYYVVALFFKEPIALQILFLLGLIWASKNRTLEEFLPGEGLLLAAAGALIIWLSFFNNAQIGIRHILPALAIDVIIAGAVFSSFDSLSRTRKVIMGLLLLWLGLSTLSYFPHMIPYMNEWVFDRRLSYKILADSNLDWGQNESLVRDFLRNNPDVILNPKMPVSGRVLINANNLVGVFPREKPLFWALQYSPVAHVGYAHFLYVIPADIPADEKAR